MLSPEGALDLRPLPDKINEQRVTKELNPRMVAPSPEPLPKSPRPPSPVLPNPPKLTFTKLPNNLSNNNPCNSPLSATPPPTQEALAREPATRTAAELAEWRKVAAQSKQALAKPPPQPEGPGEQECKENPCGGGVGANASRGSYPPMQEAGKNGGRIRLFKD
jgi:hypothetical protein